MRPRRPDFGGGYGRGPRDGFRDRNRGERFGDRDRGDRDHGEGFRERAPLQPDNGEMRELVEYIAKSLVENPEGVRVDQTRGHQSDMLVLRLMVPEAERGKVIGREGRIAKAIRDLIRVGAGRQGRRALLEIR